MATVEAKADNQSAEETSIYIRGDDAIDECLIKKIENYVEETTNKPQIGRVPPLLSRSKSYEACIYPLIVSIGPYHHGKQELEAFEKLKTPIAKIFCSVNKISIEELYTAVVDVGKSARECYEEGSTGKYDDKSFNRMMFLDACFVVYFIGGGNVTTEEDGEKNIINETNARLGKSFYLVLRDLFLLENQIPLLVLEVLMKFKLGGSECQGKQLIQDFLDETATIMPLQEYSCTDTVKKFLAGMMGSCCKSEKEMDKRESDFNKTPPHLLHLMREQLIGPDRHDIKNLITFLREPEIRESYRSVTEFESAGIYFKPSQTRSLTDVDFKSNLVYGVLTLPQIKVDHVTKPLLLNMVAYEMCTHGPSDSRITSYVCLMDSLIDHADDVKELRKKRILINKLGSDEQLAQLFNEIANDLVPDPTAYAHARLQIDKHCKSNGHIWIAEWVHKYFSSPWTLLAFLGAFIILTLTVVQTYFAVYPRQTSEDKAS